MRLHNFAAAAAQEVMVFGAARPGYSRSAMQAWIEFMQGQDIRRLCCLLSQEELTPYAVPLLHFYNRTFGQHQVCWSPIPDLQLASLEAISQTILPFVHSANQQRAKVVVHCAAGIGRTGHVLAAWLVHGRGYSNAEALQAVMKMGRNPYEAVAVATGAIATQHLRSVQELEALLDACRRSPRFWTGRVRA